jgi:hypothetical protein
LDLGWIDALHTQNFEILVSFKKNRSSKFFFFFFCSKVAFLEAQFFKENFEIFFLKGNFYSHHLWNILEVLVSLQKYR